MKKVIYQIHRKLALWLALPVILWALSGLLHPMMANWLKPAIAKKFIAPAALDISASLMTPAEVFADVAELHQLKVIGVGERVVYLGIKPDQSQLYRDALTGEHLATGAEGYAEQLARAYADDHDSKLLSITKITEFGANYSTINRLLPVYRVKLDREDGLEVVVDPRTGRLATYDSPSKRLFAKLFAWFHTWSFLGAADSVLRITVVLVVSGLAMLVSFSGLLSLILLKARRPKNQSGSVEGSKVTTKVTRKMKPSRRLHRVLGGISAVFFFSFGLSGVFHVVMKYDYDDSTQWVSQQVTQTGSLSLSMAKVAKIGGKPLSKVSLAVIGDSPYYRVVTLGRSAEVMMVSASEGEVLSSGDEVYAKELALEFAEYGSEQITKTELIGGFRADYGFIFKRLPVWRVSFQGQNYWQYTVDTEDAHMSMRTSALSLVEALSFVNFHKLHFLDFTGKQTRDIASLVLMLLILSVVFLGLLSRGSKRRKKH